MFSDDVTPSDLVHNELIQQEHDGHDVTELRARFDNVLNTDPHPDGALWNLLSEVESLHTPVPMSWGDIESTLPANDITASPRNIGLEHIEAAWLGRVIGNMLGKPVEWGDLWTRDRIKEHLVSEGAYPLLDYIPVDSDRAVALEFRENWTETTRGRVAGSARDDDVDYTVLALCLLEKHGLEFTTEDVAAMWLERLPFHQIFTAERAAYRNLVNGVPPHRAALSANPYRLWIGALIRADMFGYINPGNPRSAAELAHRDARLSHVSDGVYGAMWAGALIAAAFTASTPRAALDESLKHIPMECALRTEINYVIADFDNGLSWEAAMAAVESRHTTLNWVHTINNAGAICAGLLWGAGDFTKTIGLTVQAGLDTDSNGATAGSVAGALYGMASIPARLRDPIDDRIRSAVFGFNDSRISDLASRSYAFVGSEVEAKSRSTSS